jgi:tetraacyldisaccharide 4'-kinase
MKSVIERMWYGSARGGPGAIAMRLLVSLLIPLSWLFQFIAARRRAHYQRELAAGSLWRPSVPVIVVGNISVGGTGKTPVVIAVIEQLRALGYHPGVVSRGYGGKPGELPLSVNSSTAAAQCGDEPLLIHARTGCPVVVDPDRSAAVRHLLANTDIDIVVSDDGLQHYRLYRDIELAIVDGQRGLGNGYCLPAGPLREPPARLAQVDAVLLNGGSALPQAPAAQGFTLRPTQFVNVSSGETRTLDGFAQGQLVHAVAGIGNPARFFETLSVLGLAVDGHAFPDHHHYSESDIDFDDDRLVVMTEKDAVKCRAFAVEHHWYLRVDAQLPESFLSWLRRRLQPE